MCHEAKSFDNVYKLILQLEWVLLEILCRNNFNLIDEICHDSKKKFTEKKLRS